MKLLVSVAVLLVPWALSAQSASVPRAQDPRPVQLPDDRRLIAELASESRRTGGTAPKPDLVRSALQTSLGPKRSFESDQSFVSEHGGATFTWEVPERYEESWRAWRSLRTVEVPEPSEHRESIYGYVPSFVHPEKWPLMLDGCRTRAADKSPLRFSWNVRRNGASIYRGDDVNCLIRIGVPEDGAYDVTMDVRSQNGWRDSVTGAVHVTDLVIVSLGDSSASGEGNPDDAGLDSDWVYRRCHRSKTSGHALAAEAMERHSSKSSVTYLSFACSGAELGTGVLGRYAGQAPMPALNNIPSSNWEVRSLDAQVKAAQEALCTVPLDQCRPEDVRRPDFLFVAVGVNDLGFVDVLTICGNLKLEVEDLIFPVGILARLLGAHSCNGEESLEKALGSGLTSIATEFEPGCGAGKIFGCFIGIPNFGDLRRRLDEAGIFPTKGVYLTTYPAEPFSSSSGDVEHGCGVFRFIDGDEAKFISKWGHRLNDLIHREAIRNGFFSVSGITKAFSKHGYCAGTLITRHIAGQPVITGTDSFFVPLTDSIVSQLGIDGTMHPNRAGHEAIRDAILASIVANKPNRQPTQRLTVSVERIRFDLPGYPAISGNLEFSTVPFEVIDNNEVRRNGRMEQVSWKQAFHKRAVKITAGEWQTLADPVRLQVDIAATDQQFRFEAWARVEMEGGPEGGVAARRQRPRDPRDPNETPETPPTDPVPGKTGFYLVEFFARRGDNGGTFGAGLVRRKGKVDNGNNPGSMSVEVCVTLGPIDSYPRPPSSGVNAVSCSGQQPTKR